jgi:hypothetical protein
MGKFARMLERATYLIFIILFVSCNNFKASQSKTKDVINGEILIDLKNGVDPSLLLSSFKKYNLQFSKLVSFDLNIVLYKFNNEKIDIEKLIKKVKKIEGVENAQSNKKIANRR